ncbi:MBL fold metallo-hydrolase [Embleya sp. NBC_00888]|uniref:MBL fold metallo-hydrolase n=1 Tax=Embleya sp. NBC_00888 TaxID=2975960 RepID=UPI003865E841|nr:MBL fold metallo-hydrolase [Embleya sp. NBC_00888]
MVRAEQPKHATWEPIGPGVLRRRLPGLELNVAVVTGRDGILLVDTGSHDHEAANLLASLARELPAHDLPERVVAVVNTHGHFDHCYGNDEVLRAFPDAEVWGHADLPDYLERYAEAGRASGISHGFDPDLMNAARIVPPTRLVAREQPVTVDLGGREVVLYAPGRGHTDHDLVVHVPDCGVLIAGDIVEESGPPLFGSDAFAAEWSDSLARVRALDASVWLPGHGAVVDTEFVIRQNRWLADVAAGRVVPD